MINQKKNALNLVIASMIILLGCSQAFASKVTLPLKQYEDGAIYFQVKYGPQKCEMDIFPVFSEDCYNIISNPSHQTDVCGAKYIGDDSFSKNPNYSTEFDLGNIKTNLKFVTSNYYDQVGKRQLCFSFQRFKQDNLIVELFENKVIQNQITYVNLNSTTLQNVGDAVVGTIDIGEPDASLIKQGASFIELAVYSIPDSLYYSAYCQGALYSDQPLGVYVYAHFNLDSPFTQLPSDSVNQILKVFDQKNIKYRTEQIIISKPADIFLPSVDQIEPLYIYLKNRYGKIYTVTLQPYQLYRQLPSGEYQLLIQQQLGHLNYIQFGSTVFDTYYIGFDFQNESVQIVEKAQKQKSSSFRGSYIVQ
ncbi:transmembrane protein, putative (macronuclear) [Tetrahymena thermophila SB210]|uniref:Transmembrane protein, putative n=1 Tax=Tetrahymena thermophila (strain SB210) TaxID=312017 RepID=I7MMF5_TETTS|nr:transmembrane protein, putative [Tetrahymena thermophila SB210]EAS04752.1 transmembrane protein, putative [Tetrahymena thermophila SB210]|eukprot:XP_001024997.1 transmembrane protein, putative [Tetrahymena thermophila SB210]